LQTTKTLLFFVLLPVFRAFVVPARDVAIAVEQWLMADG